MGTRIARLFGAAIVVFGFATGAAAQSDPIHRGVVYDHTDVPMPGVVVTIHHPQQQAVRVVLTDQWGEYAVADLERGTRYTVSLSHPLFRPARVQAAAGDHINVKLKPRRSLRLVAQGAHGERQWVPAACTPGRTDAR